MEVANPSSQDRTPRRAIVLALSPAAAPYRASGLVQWYFSDMAFVLDDVRSWGAKRKLSALSEYFAF
jgi:hypothetical protein